MNLRKRRRLYHTPSYHTSSKVMSRPSKDMSFEDAETRSRVVWTADEERILLSQLQKLENTKPTTQMWNQVASSMEKPSKGAPKTGESCKTKWNRVSHFILFRFTLVDYSAIQLKENFKTIKPPEDPTSRYILDMYRVSKCMSYLTDCHFPSAVGNINDISNGLKLYFI